MYHSINIIRNDSSGMSINTWEDWGLIPSSRPVFAMPKKKKRTIDIPGMDGVLDLSDAYGESVFENREGSFEFIVASPLLEDQSRQWFHLYSIIANAIHGRRVRLILEDDPNYYYEGKLSFNEWRSDPTYSLVVLDYSVGPYKYAVESSIGPWRWDPFDFEIGVIRNYGELVNGSPVNGSTVHGIIIQNGSVINGGEIVGSNTVNGTVSGSTIVPARGLAEKAENKLIVVGGRRFADPTLIYCYASNLSVSVYTTDQISSINWTEKNLVHTLGPLNGGNASNPKAEPFSGFSFEDRVYMLKFTGNGVVTLNYRLGSL